jgi:hypothetical protein
MEGSQEKYSFLDRNPSLPFIRKIFFEIHPLKTKEKMPETCRIDGNSEIYLVCPAMFSYFCFAFIHLEI